MTYVTSPTTGLSRRLSMPVSLGAAFWGAVLLPRRLSLGGVTSLLKTVPASAKTIKGPLLGFQGIPVSAADTVVVPSGYTAEVLIAWGDPVRPKREPRQTRKAECD